MHLTNSNTALIQQLCKGITTKTAEETSQIAREFATCVSDNQILALHGDLGTGKTTFVRGLAQAWNIVETVTSPTFNLYTLYQGSRQLLHLDAYRLSSGNDLSSLMIDDFLSPPWCMVVEWPERIAEELPEDAWHIYLDINSDTTHQIRLDLDLRNQG